MRQKNDEKLGGRSAVEPQAWDGRIWTSCHGQQGIVYVKDPEFVMSAYWDVKFLIP
jgi:hypothetical protein